MLSKTLLETYEEPVTYKTEDRCQLIAFPATTLLC